MWYYLLKVALTAVLVVAVSEISKRSSLLGGVLASLPLVSYLGMIWLYIDTGSTTKVSELSRSIFWLVLPSLSFFLLLPWLLKKGMGFGASFGISTVVMIGFYLAMVVCLKKLGIQAQICCSPDAASARSGQPESHSLHFQCQPAGN